MLNIGRSTMAEGVFRYIYSSSQQQQRLKIDNIDSAGTGAYHVRDPPDPRTMATLRQHGITNYNHSARKVTKDDFHNFDYILAMDQYNLRDLLRLRDGIVAGTRAGTTKGRNNTTTTTAPAHTVASTTGQKGSAGDTAVSKIAEVRLFGDFNSDGTVNKQIGGGQEIEDPYYGGINGFEIAYEQASRFSKGFLAYLENNI